MSSKFAQLLIKENIKKINFIKNKKKICENCPKKIKKTSWTTDKNKRLEKKNWKLINN